MSDLLQGDLAEFAKSSTSQGRIIWGPAGTGKTEIAQRLAGLREGIPPLDFGAGVVAYVSGSDGKLDLKGIVDQLPSKSILFVDNSDKILDPSEKMLNDADAVQTRNAIINHFSRKQIYWVLLGTFQAARNGAKLTVPVLEKSVGPEIASRFDFLDWELASWKTETLLKAIRNLCEKRGVSYDDDALLLLTDYCLKNGGGVRTFENIDMALKRRVTDAAGVKQTVTKELAQDYIMSLGIKVAA